MRFLECLSLPSTSNQVLGWLSLIICVSFSEGVFLHLNSLRPVTCLVLRRGPTLDPHGSSCVDGGLATGGFTSLETNILPIGAPPMTDPPLIHKPLFDRFNVPSGTGDHEK